MACALHAVKAVWGLNPEGTRTNTSSHQAISQALPTHFNDTDNYFFRITWIAYAAGFWVYPFLRIMPNSFRAVFFLTSFCILVFFYFLGKWMTLFIWLGKLVSAGLTCSFGVPFINTRTLLNQSLSLLSIIILADLSGNRSSLQWVQKVTFVDCDW